jgi:Na+-translocating ferredoxin:NAD+ oxidoreductase RnfE subunit
VPLIQSMPMHLGALHAYEAALLAVLAFGPFVVLAVVVVVLRRRDADRDR